MSAECATCGHPQSQHKTGKGGCRACDLGCARFEPETAAQPAVEPVPLDALDLAKPDPGASTWERLREVEQELARIDEAAGRDIAKPDEPLVERVVDLRRGRTEATERALELAAELASAREEIDTLNVVLEQAEQYARDLQDNGNAPAGTDALLDQADATKAPAIVRTSDTIRDLIGQLREQLTEHESREELREELARIEQRAEEIRRVLAEAEQPPAPIVTDKTIREWARQSGRTVDGRGRVSMELRAEYLRAQQSNESTITEGAPAA